MDSDLPITAMCICAESSKCPTNYTSVSKSHDTNGDIDLWKDSLFGRKINRFFCFTKDYPIADTYYVIEDIKLFDEKGNIPSGFVLIEKCEDSGERAFQKKVLGIKVAQRFFTRTAVSDIIVVKGKKTPIGYSYIGEINGCLVCIKFSQIPVAANSYHKPSGNAIGHQQQQAQNAPPRPPNPIDQGFVVLPTSSSSQSNNPPKFSYNQQQFHPNQQQQQPAPISGPLHGVPFQINPIYDTRSGVTSIVNSQSYLKDGLDRSLAEMNDNLEKYNYDFKLERSLIAAVGNLVESF